MSKIEFEDDINAFQKAMVGDNIIDEPVSNVVESENPLFRYSVVELPSKGKLGYPAEVEYRDILVKDEKEISGATEKTFTKILNNVLRNLLKDKSYFEQLTIADRDYLLLWIWANSYSTIKHVEAECPECSKKAIYPIDITKINVKDIDSSYQNPTPYTTKNGTKIGMRMLTVKDEEIAKKYATGNKDVEELFVLLCCSVVFDAVMPLKEKIKRIENNFTGSDMAVIRGFHSHYKYGIDDTIEKECVDCGYSFRVPLPINVDWFLPTNSEHFGKTVQPKLSSKDKSR